MKYPSVLSERNTLELAIAGKSIARYGDGELKLALGHDCISQKRDPDLAIALRSILVAGESKFAIACIPNVYAKGTKPQWQEYGSPKYVELYNRGTAYGSSFITRPDSAPWIDTPEYWRRVADLWRGKDVLLVKGTERSLRESMLPEAASVRSIAAPRRDAWTFRAELFEEIGTHHGPVLLCLGPTATVMAWQLGARGVHGLDLGHIGMFMRHAGAYRYTPNDLASPRYREILQEMRLHQKGWGGDGAKHAAAVKKIVMFLNPDAVLDYGCGNGRLRQALKGEIEQRVLEYDPGIRGKEGLPKPCDLVVCTDVLEHVEPERISAVLDHLYRVAAKNAYLVIATRPANARLPDGRNAHLLVKPAKWWLGQLAAVGWHVLHDEEREGRDLTVLLEKRDV
jgi:hypothetical protein